MFVQFKIFIKRSMTFSEKMFLFIKKNISMFKKHNGRGKVKRFNNDINDDDNNNNDKYTK